MDNLKLTFPSPHPGTHLLVETREKEFSQWLEELPSGNMPRFVIEVADAITNINRTDMPIAQRINLVQLVDLAYEKIHNYYRPLMKAGPHKGKHAAQCELKEIYRLTREMSFAYKIAVYAYFDKDPFFGKNKKLANAINMALHYLGLILLEHYELYAPIPMHIWREIHQLYFTAEQKNLSELESPNLLNNCFSVSETTYLRICLLSISNPYHLKRGDHWEVFIYLGYWTRKSLISDDSDDFSAKNCSVINLDGDNKPLYVKDLSNKSNPHYRFLLTNQLTLKIRNQMSNILESNKSLEKCFSTNVVAKKALLLLEDMLSSWESKLERETPRYPRINKMEVIWGLGNICNVINESTTETAEDDELNPLIEQDWNTVNSSDGGICITQHTEKLADIDVGLLVAIRKSYSDQRETSWKLGVIVWIVGNKRNGMQIGIQYLKGDIQAVQLQARKGNKIDTRDHPSLMLTEEQSPAGVSAVTLLSATGLYIESRPMLLRIGEQEQFIHARLSLGSLGTVDRFYFQKAHQHNVTNNPETESEPEKEDKVTKDTSAVEDDKISPEDEDTEIINLSAMPTAHIEDFDAETEQAKQNIKTLDDMIVSKNK